MNTENEKDSEREPDAELYTAEVMFLGGYGVKVFLIQSPRKTGHLYHSHNYMQIMYVTRGICHHWIGGKSHDLVRGDGFVIPPYQIHKTELDDQAEIFCCEFLISAIEPDYQEQNGFIRNTRVNLSFMSFFLSEQTDVKPRLSFSLEEEGHIEHLIGAMMREYQSEKRYKKEMLNLYVQELLIIYARKYDSIARENDTRQIIKQYRSAVQDAMQYIHERYAQPISLKDICQVAAVSKTYFCYLFKLMTEKTFVNYLNDVRIRAAVALLEETDKPVTEICFEVGFQNLSHFARTFVKTMGVPAKAYRARKREDSQDAEASPESQKG